MSHRSAPHNSQTGQLDRRTILHKRYLIQRTIGQGGMGAVYQAKDIKRQGAICAIKAINVSLIPPQEQPQAIQNFKVEAKILWGLNHPNLPSFTGFFSENQRYFLVMEYIDGMTLDELLEHNGAPFPERRVLGWARQLCDVLEYLHSQRPPIIFRDMKPSNIMLTRSGHIKLIDFGIARFFRPTGSQDTQQLGTPGFAPPEQYGGAQTDVRSDIYSLGMTLFQLLTNTLSEQVFGLTDVRAINPQISPVVARALEKAAAYNPQERYSSVAEFRAALLGIGFVFDNGDLATTPQELAELGARYPEEASDYLVAGEIEAWLHEIGEPKLARESQRIRTQIDDPQEAIERLLQVIMGPHARVRPSSTTSASGNNQAETTLVSTSRVGWLKQKPSSPIHIDPRTLDFGQVYPGISAPLALTVSGNQGLLVSGAIYSSDAWILLDQTQFDGMSTRINVRINSAKLHESQHYTGTIIISPDTEGTKKDMRVSVEVDLLGYSSHNGRQQYGGKSSSADMDEDEDEYDVITIGTTSASQIVKPATQQMGHLSLAHTRDSEYKKKYGQPGSNAASSGWDPLQATATQRLWMKRGLIFTAAFMISSLFYILLSHTPALLHAPPLPPSPWFIVVLVGILPTTTLGALLVNWDISHPLKEMVNRACTGMLISFLLVTFIRFVWQTLHFADLPAVQLVVMLLIASLGAIVGTNPMISTRIISSMQQALSRLRVPVMVATTLAGGLLGYLLTIGSGLSFFTVLGILAGVGIAVLLLWRVDSLVKHHHP